MEHGELYQYRKISPSQIILHSNSNSIIDLFRKPFNSALLLFPALVLVGFCLDLGFSHSHSHDHDHHHCGVDGHAHALHYHHQNDDAKERTVLPEELAEEEDFKLYGFGYPHHHHHYYSEDKELSGLVQGKPWKGIVDSLALFGEGAMLGGVLFFTNYHMILVAKTLILMITMQIMNMVLILDIGIHILYRIFLQECPT
ncbi:unnamed protein product [Lupinus luteus]|uniref:IAA-alanine resistance protein 1 n=1 Tax=Lupinus luteus TaxID=3873 RepID=A0AAV1Y6W9_LUPLU